MVMLGLLQGRALTEFTVRPFPGPAMIWQLFQGMTFYVVILLLSELQLARSKAAAALEREIEWERSRASPASPSISNADEAPEAIGRYFVRTGGDILPVDVDSIVHIAGADDYAEVITVDGRHLVRLSLAELERALPPSSFVRVHRSKIVNLNRVAKAESAGGGRLLLHMENGEVVAASRAGTRLVRDRVL